MPLVRQDHLLIQNEASVISAGTEKMVMDLASKSLLSKARERPDHVRRVIQKVREDGLVATVKAVRARLDEPMSMGYASAGTVLAVGDGVQQFKVGDRVASNGPHAGVVCVAKHLCARVGGDVPSDQAAFAVLGAIALQGVRLTRTQLGETVFVIGLGLVGQLAVALLAAAGVRVLGTDPDAGKCELARRMGADVAEPGMTAMRIQELSRQAGADAVLIAASTPSNGPIELAAQAVRQKGRVVLVGVVGLELDRRPFYFKEAEFVVSCSYGPGRYDADYEEGGHDYPLAYVRWTEQRNMQAVLDLMAAGRLDVTPLISHRFDVADAQSAYQMIEEGAEPFVGVVLEYADSGDDRVSRAVSLRPAKETGDLSFGLLGVGGFARTTLLPAILKSGAFQPKTLCSATGLSAVHYGERAGFERATTEEREVFDDPNIGVVFCLTRHHLHARQVAEALSASKHVFVEKPLCLTVDELAEVEEALINAEDRLLMVGFNRRFAPATLQVREFLEGTSAPLTASIRFNAGAIRPDHWTQDESVGGGRIIGEACHAIDLATYLVDSPPVRVVAESVSGPQAPSITDDQCFITLRHENGSVSNIAYLAGGDKAFAKERVEVFGGGQVAVIDDFREVTLVRGGKLRRNKSRRDKGHEAEIRAFGDAIRQGGEPPIAWHDIRAVTLASIMAVQSLRTGEPVDLTCL